MSEITEPMKIVAQAVERAVNPATGHHSVRVRLVHTTPEGFEYEWSIWVPGEDSFERAVDLARKELHRISVKVASLPAPDDGIPVVDAAPDGTRLTIRTPSRGGGGWMGS